MEEHLSPDESPQQSRRLVDDPAFAQARDTVQAIRDQVSRVIIGQERMLDYLLVGILTEQHILVQGMPGLAKTLMAKTLSRTLNVGFSRIQFTPDLMPSDIVGTNIFNFKTQTFEFHQGPVFSNFILADEINRAPAKSQSALFEVMEERQITIDGTRYVMDDPFIIIATQNPIDLEGTYRLPEAQLDRFAMRVDVDYPSAEEELDLLQRYDRGRHHMLLEDLQVVCGRAGLQAMKSLLDRVVVDDQIYRYITQVVRETRASQDILVGASPRAAISMLRSSKAMALMHGRDYVTPDDVVEIGGPTLVHRITLSPNRSIEGTRSDEVVRDLIHRVEVPR